MMAAGSHTSSDYFKSIFVVPAQHKKIFVLAVLLVLFYTLTGKQVKNNDFDYFVFSQRWLPSACIEYIEQNSSSDTPRRCVLPNNFKHWSIHGLWPTRINKTGPYFCNNSMPFCLEKLRPIESILKLTWPNIEGGKEVDSLWEHEWNKHGTCAAQLESLNSEFKYFNATLNLFKLYNMENIFTKNNYLPGPKNGFAVSDLINVIQSTLRKLPQIRCIHEVKTNQPFISEIRLCYNKNLELIDCGNIHSSNFNSKSKEINSLTNCPFDRKIILPDSVNPQNSNLGLKNSEKKDYYDSVIYLLNLIRFLQWIFI